MNRIEKKACRVYMTDWQKRMFADFAGDEVIKRFGTKAPKYIELEVGPIKCLASYKLPPMGARPGDWVLYLDDAQVAQVNEELGMTAHVSEINISMEEINAGHIQFA